MAKHMVKCVACGKTFDTNSVQAVRVGARRYGHASCYPDNKDFVEMEVKKESDPMVATFKEYINSKYGSDVNWALISKQLKTLQAAPYNYTLKSIYNSLVYFYDVKGNPVAKANGIGIVPYVFNDAYKYYWNLYQTQEANKGKTIMGTVREIKIQPAVRKPINRKGKTFSLEDLE